VTLLLCEAPPASNVLPFGRRPPLHSPAPARELSTWARHIIICAQDAFPKGTVASLEWAKPADCFSVIDHALDASQGSPFLGSRATWVDLWSELNPSDGREYEVLAHHIAPTHIHVLIKEAEGFDLEATVDRWKAAALSDPNCVRIPDRRFWAPGYYDTILEEAGEIDAARVTIGCHDAARPTRRWR
jgi:hypothetical protein